MVPYEAESRDSQPVFPPSSASEIQFALHFEILSWSSCNTDSND